MLFFAVPYQVHFSDTMAYGTHHFLTNFRFQCFAREAMYFSDGPQANRLWEHDADVALLTYEGYSKNLAPVGLGRKVAIFLSMGGETDVSLYLFFRVLRFDGEPVCCGFQRAVCTSRASGELAELPGSVTQFVALTRESLEKDDFIAAAMEDEGRRGLNRLFPQALKIAAGQLLQPGGWSPERPYVDVQ
jgi:acyl-CoA thioesterase FadM